MVLVLFGILCDFCYCSTSIAAQACSNFCPGHTEITLCSTCLLCSLNTDLTEDVSSFLTLNVKTGVNNNKKKITLFFFKFNYTNIKMLFCS